MSNTLCFFCKHRFDEHSQEEIDSCLDKFIGGKG